LIEIREIASPFNAAEFAKKPGDPAVKAGFGSGQNGKSGEIGKATLTDPPSTGGGGKPSPNQQIA